METLTTKKAHQGIRYKPENGLVSSESMNKVHSSDSLQQEERKSRLEEVVEKMIHMTDHVDNTQPVEHIEEPPKTEETGDKDSLKEDNNTEETNKEVTEVQDTEKEEKPEEALSPSQSESSRATRWEALADIAAELPPSLTVDPITGQIYSLAK